MDFVIILFLIYYFTMPKVSKNIPYYKVQTGNEYECYQLHKPTDCRLKFPLTNEPIHKCQSPHLEYTMVSQPPGWRTLVVPKKDPTTYPAIMHRSEYDRLWEQAKIVTQEDRLAAIKAKEQLAKEEAKKSENRKKMLKKNLKQQPGAQVAAGSGDPELDGPDQAAHTVARAEILRADAMPGPRLCNRIILASKCHAIRDAQITEKELIQKELDEEQRRLDAIMEENRQAACERAEAEEKRRHDLRLQNLEALKKQISANETAKVMEAERIEEESIRVNQANIAIQIDEAQKQKEKHLSQIKLKAMLDQGNADILYFKQLQNEEDRILDLRMTNFLKQKMEREAQNKKEAEALKAAKQKGIDHIAKAQKAEQLLKEELDRIRNLKIQEDVEREYRRKERDAAIKRNREMKELHKARVEQINDIHRIIAREIAKDEQSFNNVARQNEEFIQKEKQMEEKQKARIEQHRQEIMKQINDKERIRAEIREKIHNEGVALRLEQDQQEKYERKIIKMKVDAMRTQKIAGKYVKEVEQTLAKHGYKD